MRPGRFARLLLRQPNADSLAPARRPTKRRLSLLALAAAATAFSLWWLVSAVSGHTLLPQPLGPDAQGGVGAAAAPACDAGGPGMANPAAVYCQELGYEHEIVDAADGQRGVCRFPDGSTCDAWRFLEGRCGQSRSYCATQGYDVITKTDGRSPFSTDYAVCVRDREEIGPVTELMNLAAKATRGTFPVEKSPGPPQEGPPVVGQPSSFDWRNYDGQDWMTSVKDQASCGSCWAFGSVGIVEAVYNIGWNDPGLDLDLSEEYLNSDCHSYNQYQTCCGGWHDVALEFVRDNGIPDEACLPYVSYSGCSCFPTGVCEETCLHRATGECSNATCSDRCGDWASRLRQIDATGEVSEAQSEIKQKLVEKGPLAVALKMDGEFDVEGIYRCDPDIPSNHIVVLVGYDDAGGYWIAKNSWGPGWGPDLDGYFKVGYGECGIEDEVYYADPPPPPGQQRLRMQALPPEGGATDPPAGDHWYDTGTTVDVCASANPGWEFESWSGDCSGTDPCTSVYMDASKTCTASFSHEGCDLYPSGDTPVAIPDPGTTTSVINVPDGFTVGDVNVILDITHTYDWDLHLYLISPHGTRVELFDKVGGSSDNFTGTFLDDECATPITLGSAPFAGCYRPEGSLSDFDGESSAGAWTLELNDEYPGDAGTLQAWGLEFCSCPPVMPGTYTGTVYLDGVPAPDGTTVRAFLGKHQRASTPTSSGGHYVMDIPQMMPLGPPCFEPGRIAFEADGRVCVPSPRWRVGLNVDVHLSCWTPVCHQYTSADVPKPIGHYTTALSVVDVPDAFSVADVNVGPLSITHTYDEDLNVFLSSPSGTWVELFTDVGGTGDDFTGTFLDDECTTPITSGSAPFTGCYRPEGPLSDLDREDSSGVWSLASYDDWPGDDGSLAAWSLELCECGDACDADDDDDLMPNAYEGLYGCLDPLVVDGGLDPDNDALSSLGEMMMGSDPCTYKDSFAGDSDGDDYSNGMELYLGTDPYGDCPVDISHDAWPPDLNGGMGCGGHDGEINLLDVMCYRGIILSELGDPNYDQRFDLNADGRINLLDILRYRPVILTACTIP